MTNTKTILFVDDEELNRDLAHDLLDMEGYNVILASNGQEAISFYRDNRTEIDLVILDMLMPVMDGYDTFITLREINSKVRIIIISGYSDDSRIKKLELEGFEDLITKPFNIDTLLSKVKNAIN